MTFLEILNDYFRGERYEALYFIVPCGIAATSAAIVLFRGERSGFALGFSIPCLLLGLVLVVTGATVGLRTHA